MKRPRKTFPVGDGFIGKKTPDMLPNPQLDPMAFEQFIKNRGIRWVHEKAALCPNIDNIDTQQHDPNCKSCENGMIYYAKCEIHGLFQANKLERMYEVQGRWDVGEAVVTFSAYADGPDGTPGVGPAIDLQMFDRVICCDYEFRWIERIEHSPTGIDRLRYPALSVEYIATASKRYFVDQDFYINEKGHIQWKGQNQPGFNQNTDHGEIYTIAFTAQPVFIVVQLLHEIRATKGFDPFNPAVQTAIRLPQQVLIRRDYLFSHPADKDGMSTTKTPRSGGNLPPN